jgi:hypothetical protein
MDQLERPSRLLAAATQVLKPLVRLLLKYQVTYTALTPVIKKLYVDLADQEFAIEGKRQTESRISLLTGVHRKEVKRLRTEVAETMPAPGSISLGGKMVAYWLSTDGFHQNGQPNPLPRQSQALNDVSFETLVETVAHQDIRARAVLDEWLHLGVATLDDHDRVVLSQQAFIPAKGEEEKLYYWQRNLSDHINSASKNLNKGQEALLERSVYYHSLSADAVQQLHNMYRDESMELLKRINLKALELKKTHPGDHRMNAGVYFATDQEMGRTPGPNLTPNKEAPEAKTQGGQK